MPPSGFTKRNTEGIKSFLLSCFEDLRKENQDRSPYEALYKEIKGINRDQNVLKIKRSNASCALLFLCASAYQEFAEGLNPSHTWDEFNRKKRKVVNKLCKDFQNIKI